MADNYLSETAAAFTPELDITSAARSACNRDKVLAFVKKHDMRIEEMHFSNRAGNRILQHGYTMLSELLFITKEELLTWSGLGAGTAGEIMARLDGYLIDHAEELSKALADTASAEKLSFEDGDFAAYVKGVLTDEQIRISEAIILPAPAENALRVNNIQYIHEIAFLPADEIMKIRFMNRDKADTIASACREYLERKKPEWMEGYLRPEAGAAPNTDELPIAEIFFDPGFREPVTEFVRNNNTPIERLLLSNKAINCLRNNHCLTISDFVFLTDDDFLKWHSLGERTLEEIRSRINGYIFEHEKGIRMAVGGKTAVEVKAPGSVSDEDIADRILKLFGEGNTFAGFTLQEIAATLEDCAAIGTERLKHIVGRMLAENRLEYVDYRCYKVYPKLSEVIEACPNLSEKEKDILVQRLNGNTLDKIGGKYGLSRERIRQIVDRARSKVKKWYASVSPETVFDEDFYQYLYRCYALDKRTASELGIPIKAWSYLSMEYTGGTKRLEEAIDDSGQLGYGLRLKIKSYLNGNKINIDGIWVEKTRKAVEMQLVQKFCREDTTFDTFVARYNEFLRSEGINDEELIITAEVLPTRANSIPSYDNLLWKQKRTLRYYDIQGRDYTELLETLALEQYENVDISTLKFMHDYPEIMEKYDIRDQYELHNLLSKLPLDGLYHDLKFGRMPILSFGVPDREAAIGELIINNAPVTQEQLAQLVRNEYGLEVWGNIIAPFKTYYYKGVYSFDRQMPAKNKEMLSAALTEDFYLLEDIRRIYRSILPEADGMDINASALKEIGFNVYAHCAVKNYPNPEAYFTAQLIGKGVVDLAELKRKTAFQPSLYVAVKKLKKNGELVELEPEKLISVEALEKYGVTNERMSQFCNDVYRSVEEGEYFTIASLKNSGFEAALFKTGFQDYFFAALLEQYSGLSSGRMFGTIVLCKGNTEVTVRSFLEALVKKSGYISITALERDLREIYGCMVGTAYRIPEKLAASDVYYDETKKLLFSDYSYYEKYLDDEGKE